MNKYKHAQQHTSAKVRESSIKSLIPIRILMFATRLFFFPT